MSRSQAIVWTAISLLILLGLAALLFQGSHPANSYRRPGRVPVKEVPRG